MTALLKTYLNLCLLSDGPQDLPYSVFLFRILLGLYFISGVLSILPSSTFTESVMVMCVDIFVLLVFCWFCLRGFNKSSRYNQMMSAILGTGSLFQILAWPLMFYFEMAEAKNTVIPELGFLLLILISWNLAVYAHIFRHALSIRLSVAFLITLAFAILSIASRQLLFPELGA
ncbi:MAG: hypothetical protein OEY61_06335 [Gammaproteobacteria bacterium]|nr:hypothetical protein [Gammaproteobacteria bacterium]